MTGVLDKEAFYVQQFRKREIYVEHVSLKRGAIVEWFEKLGYGAS